MSAQERNPPVNKDNPLQSIVPSRARGVTCTLNETGKEDSEESKGENTTRQQENETVP